VLDHVRPEQVVAEVAQAGQRHDDQPEARVEARLPPAGHGPRRAGQAMDAQRVQDPGGGRGQQLQRLEGHAHRGGI
jgi:hypothetical protein